MGRSKNVILQGDSLRNRRLSSEEIGSKGWRDLMEKKILTKESSGVSSREIKIASTNPASTSEGGDWGATVQRRKGGG